MMVEFLNELLRKIFNDLLVSEFVQIRTKSHQVFRQKQIQLEGYIDKYRIAMNASPSCFEAHVGLSDCL